MSASRVLPHHMTVNESEKLVILCKYVTSVLEEIGTGYVDLTHVEECLEYCDDIKNYLQKKGE